MRTEWSSRLRGLVWSAGTLAAAMALFAVWALYNGAGIAGAAVLALKVVLLYPLALVALGGLWLATHPGEPLGGLWDFLIRLVCGPGARLAAAGVPVALVLLAWLLAGS